MIRNRKHGKGEKGVNRGIGEKEMCMNKKFGNEIREIRDQNE